MQSVEDRVIQAFGDKELFGVASEFHSRFTKSLSEVLRHLFNDRILPDSAYDLSHLFRLMLDYSEVAEKVETTLGRNRFYEPRLRTAILKKSSDVLIARTISQYTSIASYAKILAGQRRKNVFKELESRHFRSGVLRRAFPGDFERSEFINDYLCLFVREAQMATDEPFWPDNCFERSYASASFCAGFTFEA